MIVSYDVSSNKRRRKLARLLADRLDRVQKSVFEGWLTPAELAAIVAEAERLIERRDSLLAYSLCLDCAVSRRTAGATPPRGASLAVVA